MSKLSVQDMSKDLDLEIIYQSSNPILDITNSDINRPGLQLSGFFKYFDQDRVQIIGKSEWSFLESLSKKERKKRIDMFFSQYFPCLIVAWDLEVFEELLESAAKYDRTIFRTPIHTTTLMGTIISYLDDKLAPIIKTHGTLVEVYGIGVFLSGVSGVGKSETALELVNRGHRLIADDVVEIKQRKKTILVGSAPELLRHYIEIRGVGILDIKSLYGVGAIKNNLAINMVVEIEKWVEGKNYDRLGVDTRFTKIMDVLLPTVTIPILPGRNLAIIIEAVARNHREKIMGYNAAQVFVDKVYKNSSKDKEIQLKEEK